MKILVGSTNPVKIEATREAFSKYFKNIEVVGINVSSFVSDQPVNDETFKGAKNRVLELKKINKENKLNANFFVGLEGGIIKFYSKWFLSNVIYILNDEEKEGFEIQPLFELPENIITKLLNGVELGEVMDKLTGEKNIKQKGGAAGFFTKDKINRKEFYIIGIISALVPFINEYGNSNSSSSSR